MNISNLNLNTPSYCLHCEKQGTLVRLRTRSQKFCDLQCKYLYLADEFGKDKEEHGDRTDPKNISFDFPEVWKDVNDFPRYQISNWGRVKGIRKTFLKGLMTDGFGYPKVCLKRLNAPEGEAKLKTLYIHRIVAEHFIPNNDPANAVHVDHVNGDTRCNAVTNLQWTTPSENCLKRSASVNREGFLSTTTLVDGTLRYVFTIRKCGATKSTSKSFATKEEALAYGRILRNEIEIHHTKFMEAFNRAKMNELAEYC